MIWVVYITDRQIFFACLCSCGRLWIVSTTDSSRLLGDFFVYFDIFESYIPVSRLACDHWIVVSLP